MRIVSIGGGPSGLFSAILFRKAFADAEIVVYERNRPDDTFGWGVVFSEETLGNIRDADPESYAEIEREFAYWDDIETWIGGRCVTSTGHGFCGLSRKRLLQILHARCRALGVDLRFETDVPDSDALRAEADLVIAADGVNSGVRAKHEAEFRPEIGWGRTRFCWLGTTLPLRAFTFVFKHSPHGLFAVHAYPFEKGLSTWIVECSEDTWKRAGLDRATEAETVAYCADLFRDELKGHALLTNRSIWRSFPTIRCAHWSVGNLVLMGDAVHTAHFSIGSGTKLAMEDAIALRDAFVRCGAADVPAALAEYERSRRDDVARLQRVADVSREWFEDCERWTGLAPEQFTFHLLTRSKKITYDNLTKRDPAFVAQVAEWFRGACGAPKASDGSVPPPAFTPFRLRGLTLPNRIVVSPMCQYSATEGTVGEWHLVHLGSRAVGGAGLVIAEMTDVAPEGRITRGCAGLWNDAHTVAWRRIVDFVHANSASKIGVQLAHAGRKASCALPWEGGAPLGADGWESIGPSAIPFDAGWPAPREMSRADMDRVRDAFVAATRRALDAGFDLIELHVAHGYLLSSFLSPLSNARTDAYGGSLENRMRFPIEVLVAVRATWPADRPLAVRISATDWLGDEGTTPAESVVIARALHAAGCDVVDVSTAGNSPRSKPVYGRMYQVQFADRIRHEAGVPVMAVGAIADADHVNTIVASGRADLCCIARAHLADPYLAARAAGRYGYPDIAWPNQYLAGRPRG
ncbi:MAG: bifunctional salicylyl-CoA 5-hydroxylase/oxidoreductase [Planctomycetes bacterium]|nr:bifunctional salicylyl-CoA 5-hydroxylase/oxidoreductase [Planctomycetota bacterium]